MGRLAEVVAQVAGLPIPASVLERDVLPARVPGYQPRLLDELGAMGEIAWVGTHADLMETCETCREIVFSQLTAEEAA